MSAEVNVVVLELRNVKRLATCVAVLAFWLLGTTSTADAGCGDYLVGVAQTQQSSDPMTPDHARDQGPSCESSNQPIAPPVPVVNFERVPIDPAFQGSETVPTIEIGGWSESEPSPLLSITSETLDRPPKS